MQAWLLALALSMTPAWYPPGKNPETPLEYQKRVDTIAAAIAAEVENDRQLAAAVLVKWHAESGGFNLAVHSGARLGDDGRAICLGQVHVSRALPKADWLQLAGTDLAATRRCAAVSARLLGNARRHCGSWPRAFSAYASGRGCQVLPLGKTRGRHLAQMLQRPFPIPDAENPGATPKEPGTTISPAKYQ